MYIKWLKSLKKHGKSEVAVIIFNGKKWLNETNAKDQLKHSNLAAVTLQYSSEFRKQRQELQDCSNYQTCRRFLEEDFAMQMNLKIKLGFNQHDQKL